ncbi:MAG TPA: helix-turn-helix transcriptional regulator [Solirubrobacterales bacterium]|nr:helix-turn-helix transcriptional regulator [Solirubrobacterales bacterium]
MSTSRRRKRPRASKRRANAGADGGSSQRLDSGRGVFMISVAAELSDMHPQTLRMYEARGLITPQRSPGKTRLYSQQDVERLRRIQRMTEEGLNLVGVETVLEMEQQLDRLRAELTRMRRRAAQAEKQMLKEIERVRHSLRADLVPYGAYEPGLVPPKEGSSSVRIAVERGRRSKSSEDGV